MRTFVSASTLLACGALAATAHADSIGMTGSTWTYTGPGSGPATVDIRENPSDATELETTSATDIATDVPECGGPGTTGKVITCSIGALGQRTLFLDMSGGDDSVDVRGQRPVDVDGGAGGDRVTSGAGDDDLSGQDGDDTLVSGAGDDDADGGNGDDLLSGRDGKDEMRGGEGDDGLSGDLGDDILEGGNGADRLIGGGGVDLLRGNGGSDVLTGGAQADTLEGGDGFDRADYSDRTAAQSIVVTLNDAADDGESGENDNVKSDVEDVTGGDGADRLTGDADGNDLIGNGGNDVLDGGAGLDFFNAGPGDDVISSRDGVAERVDCGDGNDTATTDEFDVTAGCETRNASRDLQPDFDGDGTIDPQDCNDKDPTVRPGAIDVPRDGVDQDCSRGDAPYPVIDIPLSVSTSVKSTGTRFTKFQVRKIPSSSIVELRCKAKSGCPFSRENQGFTRAGAVKNFLSLFKGRRLKGGYVEVRITKPGHIGKAVRYTLQKTKVPTSKNYCIPVDSSSLKTSCS